MTNRLLVLDKNCNPLMPMHSARARKLIKKGKAKIKSRYPFTIILTERVGGDKQPLELKFDPGSKATDKNGDANGFIHGEKHSKLVLAANLEHRGGQIHEALEKRKNVRRSRRNRKTRYRQPRFLNRKRKEGWLPPSVQSRFVDNITNWVTKLISKAPISNLAVEQNKFDTQKMQNPESKGVQYQHGTLEGCETRQYLLTKWGYKCAYCDAGQGVRLEVEHVVPKAKGGSDRVSNLVMACHKCNQKKGTQSIEDFLAKKPDKLKAIVAQLKKPLKDAAVMNAVRFKIVGCLQQFKLPLCIGTGSQTHFHRLSQGLPKTRNSDSGIASHWLDAACVGDFGSRIKMAAKVNLLTIKAMGRGCLWSRFALPIQMTRVDKYGFPRSKAKMSQKRIFGFGSGDLVKAVVDNPKLKSFGTHVGRISVRKTGSFDLVTNQGQKFNVNHKYCKLLQLHDGYAYTHQSVDVNKSTPTPPQSTGNSQAQLWCHPSGKDKRKSASIKYLIASGLTMNQRVNQLGWHLN